MIRNASNEVFNGQAPPGIPSLSAGLSERVQQDFIPEICGIVNFWTRVGW